MPGWPRRARQRSRPRRARAPTRTSHRIWDASAILLSPPGKPAGFGQRTTDTGSISHIAGHVEARALPSSRWHRPRLKLCGVAGLISPGRERETGVLRPWGRVDAMVDDPGP